MRTGFVLVGMTNAAERSPESIEQDEERDDAHLDDIEEGAGCTEIWEHLAEQREDDG